MKTTRIIKVAFKGLGRNKLRTFLMMIGIVMGITALTMVVAAGLGAQKRVMERVERFGTDNINVYAGGGREMGRPREGEITRTLTLDDAEAIAREINNVAAVAPFAMGGERNVVYQDRSLSARLFGITPDYFVVRQWDLAAGYVITDEDMQRMERVCILGSAVKDELFGDENPVGEQIRIGGIPFTVKGVTQPLGGMMDYRITIPLSTLMRRVANIDHVSVIRIKLKNARKMDDTVEEIQYLLRERHNLAADVPDDFTIRTPVEMRERMESIMGTFDYFLVLVAGISLIAGGVVVANIMLISVSERKREIGLRKAVGARKKDIMRQFIYEATAVTFTGGIIGILAGAIGATLMESITETPTAISWVSVAIGVGFSTVVGFVAGLQPAKRAAVMQPVEALRG